MADPLPNTASGDDTTAAMPSNAGTLRPGRQAAGFDAATAIASFLGAGAGAGTHPVVSTTRKDSDRG